MDDETTIPDERLSLLFTCCHPALAPDAQVALTLRLVGGLTTPRDRARVPRAGGDARAAARAREARRSATAGIPYRVPPDHLLPDRLGAALAVVYLIFNEGYSATAGEELMRPDLMAEAIRLGGILAALMPDEAEVLGLEALLLLQASRTQARGGADGALVLLEDQDRSLWDQRPDRPRRRAARPRALAAPAGAVPAPGGDRFASCAGGKARGHRLGQIALLYAELARLQPSPVVELNRAVAVAMADGPAAGLELLDGLPLDRYHLFHSARADLLRREGRVDEARVGVRARARARDERRRARLLSRRLPSSRRLSRPVLSIHFCGMALETPDFQAFRGSRQAPLRKPRRARVREAPRLLRRALGLRAAYLRSRDGRGGTRHRGIHARLLPPRAGSLSRGHGDEAVARHAQEPQATQAARALSRGQREALLQARLRAPRRALRVDLAS